MTQINNFTFMTQQHDDQDADLTAETTPLGSATLNCEEWTPGVGVETTIAQITLTCLQNAIIEAFGYAVYWIDEAATLRLYIDGSLVASQALTVVALTSTVAHHVKGSRAVAAGNRVVSLRIYNDYAGANQLDVCAGVFGGCVKT